MEYWINTYALVGIVFTIIMDLLIIEMKASEPLTNTQRVLAVIFWPFCLALLLFTLFE